MNASPSTNPLDQLKAIHAPTDVSIWPLAWGWWVLIAVFILLIISAFVLWHRRRTYAKAKMSALVLLDAVDVSDSKAPAKINAIVKRVSQHYDATTGTARYYGEQWTHYLLHTLPEKSQDHAKAGLTALNHALYQPDDATPDAIREMKAAARLWILKTSICRFSLRRSVKEQHHV